MSWHTQSSKCTFLKYGVETWTINKTSQQGLEAFEPWAPSNTLTVQPGLIFFLISKSTCAWDDIDINTLWWVTIQFLQAKIPDGNFSRSTPLQWRQCSSTINNSCIIKDLFIGGSDKVKRRTPTIRCLRAQTSSNWIASQQLDKK